MRIQIFSDLHNEFAPIEPPTTDADVVVLAGGTRREMGQRDVQPFLIQTLLGTCYARWSVLRK